MTRVYSLAESAESEFYEFFMQSWPTIEGSKVFVDGPHIQVICYHLELIAKRQIKKLLINLPPRFSKSSMISVAFPAWVWLRNPAERFLCSSYALSLANRDSRYCRTLIQSPWYQQNWGERYQLLKDQNTKGRFDNDRKGYRIATSSKSASTGEGGSILIADDPNNVKDYSSKVERERRIEWWSQIWSTRLNDKKNDCLIVVQQRMHEQDISGFVLSNDLDKEWTKLILPMEYEQSRKSKTYVNGTPVWHDWRETDGELLWPERVGKKEVVSIKRTLGSYGYAAQYQQRPSPEGGGIIKKDWFKWWKSGKLPKLDHVIQSWDTAISDNPTAAYSACTTWGVFRSANELSNVILLSVWRGRVGYPELRQRAVRLQKNYNDVGVNSPTSSNAHNVDMVLIESKATGDPLIRDLRNAGVLAAPYNPTRQGDKEGRVQKIAHFIEGGLVWLPTEQPNYDRLTSFSDDFLNSVASFPSDDSKDIVDTVSQVLSYLRDHNFLNHPRDKREPDSQNKPPVLY